VIIVDTDVLINALNDQPPDRAALTRALKAGRFATTAISRMELMVGLRAAKDRHAAATLLKAAVVIPFDREAAATGAELQRTLAGQGLVLPFPDLAIAAICLGLDAELLTRNQRHFRRIAGLRLTPLE